MSNWHDNHTTGQELRLSQLSQRNNRAFKVGALVIWALLMLVVVRALVHIDDQGLRAGTKIASLSIQKGNVKFRPAESILWVDASIDQAFHDGDTIVTASGARAVIRIGEGQRIELGENSMVGLDMKALKAGGNDGVNLTLYKGNLVAMAKRPAQVKKDNLRSILSKIGWDDFGLQAPKELPPDAPVTIKSDKKTFKVSEAPVKVAAPKPLPTKLKPEAVVASTPKPEAFLISLKEPEPVSEPAVVPPPPPKPVVVAVVKPAGPTPEELAAIEAAKLAAAQAEAKAQADKAAEELAMKALQDEVTFVDNASSTGPGAALAEPVPGQELIPVVTPGQNLTLYTGESLKDESCAAEDVHVDVQPSKDGIKAWKAGNKPKSWVGFLDVASSTDSTSKFRVFASATRFGKQTIKIPAQEICRLPRSPNAVGVSLNLTPGVVFKVGGPDAVGAAATRMFVGSLADFPAMPITVYVTKIGKAGKSRRGWVPQGAAPTGGYAIRLKTAQDLPALYDLIKSTGSFSYANASVDAMTAKVHLASNGLILATVGAASYTKADIRAIAARLDANVAFTGQASSLIALPKASINRINALETALDKQGTIRVMSRNRIVTLRREDAQLNADQIRMLARTATGALTKDAKVVVP